MFSVTRAGPEVPLSEVGNPNPAIESSNMAGFASFGEWLNDYDVALHEFVVVWILHVEFAESHPSQNRAIILCMGWLIPDDATTSLQGKPNVHRAFALTMSLGILAQVLGKSFGVERHDSS
jgi:hypothetical protein